MNWTLVSAIVMFFVLNFGISVGFCYLYDWWTKKREKRRFSPDTILLYKYIGKNIIEWGTLVDLETDMPNPLGNEPGLFRVSKVDWRRTNMGSLEFTVTYELYDPPTLADFGR